MERDVISGKVKFFNTSRGYGFIEPDEGGKDIFVHVSGLPYGVESLAEGQKVEFEMGKGRDGRPCADNVVVR